MTVGTTIPKDRICKVCCTPFSTILSFRNWCGPTCGLVLFTEKNQKAEKAAAVKDKRETKAKLDKLKSRSQYAKEAQTAFNTWVRARDAGNACISCGRHHQGQNHAGHYLSVGARPELRYEPLNVWLQCAPCNTHLSGNAVLYRQALLAKIGQAQMDWLEGHHPTRHYTVEELKAIKADYTARARELQKGMS